MDVHQKRLHVPLVDRSASGKPPVIVAVVGPPKVRVIFMKTFTRAARQQVDF
jgi:hypothetical protein